MPRSAKRDLAITNLLQANGLLTDKRSFVSLGIEPHLYLSGVDAQECRARIYSRDDATCQLKLAPDCWGRMDFYACHLEHKQGGLVGRCWCDHNLRIACPPCHELKHNRNPRWTKKDSASVSDSAP